MGKVDYVLAADLSADDAPAFVGLKLDLNGHQVSVPEGYQISVTDGIAVIDDGPLRKRAELDAAVRRGTLYRAADKARADWVAALLSMAREGEDGLADIRAQVEGALCDATDAVEQTRLGTDIICAYAYLRGTRR